MWNFVSNCISGSIKLKNESKKPVSAPLDCSDDECSLTSSREEGLECPICWESFNMVENVPYVLWCGHTLCKNCILGLQWAVVKFPNLPLQLPLFISCPWCYLLSPRLVYKGNLKFPRKNFFLLWMIESLNGERVGSHSAACADHQTTWLSSGMGGQYRHFPESSGSNHAGNNLNNHFTLERVQSSVKKFLVLFVNLTAKFPLILLFLLIILYALPACATILALYVLVTVLFALPSFLVLYFAYPTLDWLVREIFT